MSKQKGFSLIELIIVVAIILLIAAMAIPNLIRSKMAANEASAVASLRAINTAEIVYSSTYTVANVFSANLVTLGDGGTTGACSSNPTSTDACLIDSALEAATTSTASKSGYYFTYAVGTGAYSLQASPVTVDSTGVRFFYTDQTAVIRENYGAAATTTSSPI